MCIDVRWSELLDDITRVKLPSLGSSQLVIGCVTSNHRPHSLCLLFSIKRRVVFVCLIITIYTNHLNMSNNNNNTEPSYVSFKDTLDDVASDVLFV